MADAKISAFSAITGANVDTAADVLAIVDTSATETKKIVVDELATAMAATQAEVNAMTSTNTVLTPNLNKIILGTEVATTSGTAVDFTGFPAAVRKITVMFAGVSTNGTSDFLVQLGDSGGIENTGYTALVTTGAGTTTSTAGFLVADPSSAANGIGGMLTLVLENATAFTWVGSGNSHETSAPRYNNFSGNKSLSAELTQLRFTTVNGTDTFDAGAVNVAYER